MKKYDNFCSNLRVLEKASEQDLENEFIISGIIDKFFIQFELGWKLIKELIKYEGRPIAASGSPRSIIKEAYKIYDFFDEDNPENVIGHCILHDTNEGVMCDIHFNEMYLKNHTVNEALCSRLKIGAWAVRVKKEPTSKFGNNSIITHGYIRAVAMNEYCLEEVVIGEEKQCTSE